MWVGKDSCLHAIYEILRQSVLESEFLEVLGHSLFESILPYVVLESLDEAGSFLIAYAIEHIHRVNRVLDLDLYGVGDRPLHIKIQGIIDKFSIVDFRVGIDVSRHGHLH